MILMTPNFSYMFERTLSEKIYICMYINVALIELKPVSLKILKILQIVL
jgi:hypothetical protein